MASFANPQAILVGDMGGTKATLLCASVKNPSQFETLVIEKPGNIRTAGREGFADRLRTACIHFGISNFDDVASLVLGVSGIEVPSDRRAVLQAVGDVGIKQRRVKAYNDTKIGLIIPQYVDGAKASLVSGTGANTAYDFERANGKINTVGGSWYLGSDRDAGGVGLGISGFFRALEQVQSLTGEHHISKIEGSKQSLRSFINEKGSPLVKLFVQRLGVTDLTNKYPEIYANKSDGEKVQFFSPLAPLVTQAANQGDLVAKQILRDSGLSLARLFQLGLKGGHAMGAGTTLVGGLITLEGPARDAFLEAMGGYDLQIHNFPDTTDLLLALAQKEREGLLGKA